MTGAQPEGPPYRLRETLLELLDILDAVEDRPDTPDLAEARRIITRRLASTYASPDRDDVPGPQAPDARSPAATEPPGQRHGLTPGERGVDPDLPSGVEVVARPYVGGEDQVLD